MRTAIQGVQDLLASGNECWRATLYTVTVSTGKVFRWTDSDHDLTVDGAVYYSGGGANPMAPIIQRSGMRSNIGLQIDTMDITLRGPYELGGYTLPRLGAQGYFDGADVKIDLLFGASPGDTSLDPIDSWFIGVVADCQPTGRDLQLRVKSNLAKLNQTLPKFLLQPSCGNAFCDANCGLSLANFVAQGTCSATGTTTTFTSTSFEVISQASGYFDHGYVHFEPYTSTLALRDVRATISTHTLSNGTATITLDMPLKATPGQYDRFKIYAGCLRTKAACQAKNNLTKWRGFPHVPSSEAAQQVQQQPANIAELINPVLKKAVGLSTPKVYPAGYKPGVFCGNADPLPIAYGRVRLPMRLIEAAAPTITDYPPRVNSTAYYVGDKVIFTSTTYPQSYKYLYECTTAGATSATTTLRANKEASITDGTVVWTYVQDLPRKIYGSVLVGALCEGPVTSAVRAFKDSEKGTALTSTWFPWNLQLNLGASNQTLTSYGASENYENTAALTPQVGVYGRETILTGTDNTIPNFAVEIDAVRPGSSYYEYPPNFPDINPVDIIYDLLTDDRRGAGWDTGLVDVGTGAGSLRTYCDAAGLRFSFAVDSRQPALNLIGACLEAANGTAVWSQGKIKLLTNADQGIASPVFGAVAYEPANLTAIYNLTTDDFVGEIEINRVAFDDTYNTIPVEFTLRGTEGNYQRYTIETPDAVDTQQHGVRRGSTVSLPVIFDSQAPATLLSKVFVQRSLHSRNSYRFKLTWKGALIEPGDVLTLTDSNLDDQTPVRVTGFEEDNDGNYTITAIDWPNGLAAAKTYTAAGNDGFVPNYTKATSAMRSVVDGTLMGVDLDMVAVHMSGDITRALLQTIGVEDFDVVDYDTKGMIQSYSVGNPNMFCIRIQQDGIYSIECAVRLSTNCPSTVWAYAYVGLEHSDYSDITPRIEHPEAKFSSADSYPVTLTARGAAVPLAAGDIITFGCSVAGSSQYTYTCLASNSYATVRRIA